ncbi:LOW QUALITY PROTEIN: forkhead box protein E1, partial [Trichechus manatus latirostris]|uniref:LOW QUALITY PROTEIN: forkhead box protein E1 n=1 Tax=Trichechus manatus latirostris TaxID=127582 RepID=A0A2Y9FVH9_TRIMA
CAFASAGAPATTTGYQPAGCAGTRPANPSAYSAAYAGPDGAYPQGAGGALFAATSRLAAAGSPPAGGGGGGVEGTVDFYGRTSPAQFGALGPCYNPGGQLGAAVEAPTTLGMRPPILAGWIAWATREAGRGGLRSEEVRLCRKREARQERKKATGRNRVYSERKRDPRGSRR